MIYHGVLFVLTTCVMLCLGAFAHKAFTLVTWLSILWFITIYCTTPSPKARRQADTILKSMTLCAVVDLLFSKRLELLESVGRLFLYAVIGVPLVMLAVFVLLLGYLEVATYRVRKSTFVRDDIRKDILEHRRFNDTL